LHHEAGARGRALSEIARHDNLAVELGYDVSEATKSLKRKDLKASGA